MKSFVLAIFCLALASCVHSYSTSSDYSTFPSTRIESSDSRIRTQDSQAQRGNAKAIFENTQTQTGSMTKCEPSATVKILMYHYVREDNEDASGSIVSRLSINHADFLSEMRQLAKLRDAGELAIANMSDLERFENTKCYPNRHMVIPTSDDGWEDSYTEIFPIAKELGLKFTLSVISGKVGTAGKHIAGFADENEIREMIASGFIEIQSHSVNHEDFKVLDQKAADHEICDSKTMLEKEFGIQINTFVFPAGHTDVFALPALEQCGYRYALSTHKGDIDTDKLSEERFSLPRIRIAKGYNFAKEIGFTD